MQYELFGPSDGMPVTVVLGGEVNGDMTDIVAHYASGFKPDRWKSLTSVAEDALNAFFPIDADAGLPAVFVDRVDGQLAIRSGCEDRDATLTRRSRTKPGYTVRLTKGARRMSDMFRVGGDIADVGIELGYGRVANPFLQAGYNAGLERQLRLDRIRKARAEGKEPDYSFDNGAFFSVEDAGWSAPRTADPHFHDRIRRALITYGAPPSALMAWDVKEDIWSRPIETVEAKVGGLWLGALQLGQDVFGRALVTTDKTSGGRLTKLTVMSEPVADRFYNEYFDTVRRALDPRGWTLAQYLEGCRAGDPDALDAPLFFTTVRTGLTYDTMQKRTFQPIMKLAGLLYEGKPPGMHLGRHDKITKAVERIHALDVPRAVREQMLDDLAEYVAWATGRRMVPAYSGNFQMVERAKKMLGFKDRHAAPVLVGAVPRYEDEDPECLLDLFGARG